MLWATAREEKIEDEDDDEDEWKRPETTSSSGFSSVTDCAHEHHDRAPPSRLLALIPALVYLLWVAAFAWLLSDGSYKTYLRPSLWPLLALGIVIGVGFLASTVVGRPSPHGTVSSFETWLRASLLVLPLLYLVGAAHGQKLGTHALKAFGRRKRTPATSASPATSAAPTTASSASPGSSLDPAPGTAKSPAPATKATPAAKAPDKPTSLSKLTEEPDKFKDKVVLTEGLVYKGEDLPAGYFMLFRFLIVCCAADASPVGILVASDKLAGLENDDWVAVTGTFTMQQIEGEDTPCLKPTKLDRKKAPPAEEQYLYY